MSFLHLWTSHLHNYDGGMLCTGVYLGKFPETLVAFLSSGKNGLGADWVWEVVLWMRNRRECGLICTPSSSREPCIVNCVEGLKHQASISLKTLTASENGGTSGCP